MKNITLTETQKAILACFENDNWKTLIFKRQVGMTTVLAHYTIRHALENNNSTIGYISHTHESAHRFINFIQQYMGDKFYVTNYTKSSITLKNGSKILVTSANANTLFKSHTLNLVLVDNCLSINNLETIKQSLIPVVWSNFTKGKMFICGTYDNDAKGIITDMNINFINPVVI